jgi:hypothetical protein
MDEYYVHIDSKNRNKTRFPNGNTYVIDIPHVIKGAVRVDLVSAKVPNSMYNLTDGSDVLSTHNTTVSINPGFYSATTLPTVLFPVTFEYIQEEGKFVYLTNESTSTLTIHSEELAKMLGFEVNTSYTVSPSLSQSGFSYGVKSIKIVDFSLNEYVFLDIEEFRTPFTNAGNMFAMIPMDVPSTQIKTFKENTDYIMSTKLTHQQTISRLTIHWYDKDLKLLNFQGFDNNGFILRVYTERTTKELPMDDPEAAQRAMVDMYIKEIKKRLDEEAAQKEKNEKANAKVKFGKWAVILAILGVLVSWYFTKKIM